MISESDAWRLIAEAFSQLEDSPPVKHRLNGYGLCGAAWWLKQKDLIDPAIYNAMTGTLAAYFDGGWARWLWRRGKVGAPKRVIAALLLSEITKGETNG